MSQLKSCTDNHTQVFWYDKGNDCPVCLAREQLIEVTDAKTDIDQENILALFKRVEAIEKVVMRPDAKHVWWRPN